MDYESAKAYLESISQGQLLKYYNELSEEEQALLLSDIERVDFSILENLKNSYEPPRGKITPVEAITLEEIKENRQAFEAEGLRLLAEGKVAAVLLAGGQGSRLGFEGPKGTFDMGLTRALPIFKILIDNLKSVTDRVGRCCPLFIMTSTKNCEETKSFFVKNNYFGYPQEKIRFYIQEESPACSFEGKVYLDTKCRVSLAPNGNGGWYSSMKSSGMDKALKEEGIEWINLFGVDNVLQRMCDPVYIGAVSLKGYDCGAKVVKKASPEEKVGVMCNEDGKTIVVEYFELDDKMRYEQKDGELVYCYGNILNFLFSVPVLERALAANLPYHTAKKAIAHVEDGKRVIPTEPCGYKFETLVVDMVKFMGTAVAFEVEREREFAPVKNKEGIDSVDTARALLQKNGVKL